MIDHNCLQAKRMLRHMVNQILFVTHCIEENLKKQFKKNQKVQEKL